MIRRESTARFQFPQSSALDIAAPRFILDAGVRDFDGLNALPFRMDNVHVLPRRPDLEAYKATVIAGVRDTYTMDAIKDVPELRAYRDFFWRVGIDPTKIRPAAEALIRRILGGKPLPTINTLVDAYNLASIETRIALAAFDASTVIGEIVMRKARSGEEFLGIGMDEPVLLTGKEVVNADDRGLIAIYPYRDAARTAVKGSTTCVVFLACGVPGIPRETLVRSMDATRAVVGMFSATSGKIGPG